MKNPVDIDLKCSHLQNLNKSINSGKKSGFELQKSLSDRVNGRFDGITEILRSMTTFLLILRFKSI